jgi:hypothetical protein
MHSPATTRRIDLTVEADEFFLNSANECIASAAFFFLSKRFSETSVGRELQPMIRKSTMTFQIGTYDFTFTTSLSPSSGMNLYISKLIPG